MDSNLSVDEEGFIKGKLILQPYEFDTLNYLKYDKKFEIVFWVMENHRGEIDAFYRTNINGTEQCNGIRHKPVVSFNLESKEYVAYGC